jgi:cell division protein FtsB
VNNRVIATAVMAAIASMSGAAHAASPDELAEIRSQLQGLVQRVDKLEQENKTLKEENAELKGESDYLKAEARGLRKESASQEVTIGNVKGTEWAAKVAVKGDLRYRHEQIDDAALNAQGFQAADHRYRDRVRARVNVEAKATDTMLVGIGIATTEGGDSRSSNQTLTGSFSRKAIDLDLAYFDWTFAHWGHFIGGKMKQPFFKTTQSAFWDNDVNPEGLAVTYNQGMWFGSAYNYWVTEVSGAENTRTSDVSMAGVQVGTRLPIGSSTLTLAAHYYDLSAGQGRSPFFIPNGGTLSSSLANGNTTTGTTPVLVYDYEVINLTAEFNGAIGALPLMVWADVAQNQDPSDLDTAWGTGVLFGKASNPKTWEFGATYQVLEKDALFAQLIDSDFGGGTTDSEGFMFRVGYAPVRNWTLNGTYFLNKRNVDVANSVGQIDVDYDRLQLDFNAKF